MNIKERPNHGVCIQALRRMTSEDRLIKAGRMTEVGLAKVREAKTSGEWRKGIRSSDFPIALPPGLIELRAGR